MFNFSKPFKLWGNAITQFFLYTQQTLTSLIKVPFSTTKGRLAPRGQQVATSASLSSNQSSNWCVVSKKLTNSCLAFSNLSSCSITRFSKSAKASSTDLLYFSSSCLVSSRKLRLSNLLRCSSNWTLSLFSFSFSCCWMDYKEKKVNKSISKTHIAIVFKVKRL